MFTAYTYIIVYTCVHACVYLCRVCGKKNVENVLCERAFIIAVWRAVWDEGGCFRCSVFSTPILFEGCLGDSFTKVFHLLTSFSCKKNTHFPSCR